MVGTNGADVDGEVTVQSFHELSIGQFRRKTFLLHDKTSNKSWQDRTCLQSMYQQQQKILILSLWKYRRKRLLQSYLHCPADVMFYGLYSCTQNKFCTYVYLEKWSTCFQFTTICVTGSNTYIEQKCWNGRRHDSVALIDGFKLCWKYCEPRKFTVYLSTHS